MLEPKLKLGMPEVAKGIEGMHARERTGWRKTRLLTVKLVARGEATSAEIADLCGVSRGRLFVRLDTLRENGLAALLERGQPGPKEGACRGGAWRSWMSCGQSWRPRCWPTRSRRDAG